MFRCFPGTADTTVDWKYNIKFIKGKFPRAEVGGERSDDKGQNSEWKALDDLPI
jgi:hypothetical protein